MTALLVLYMSQALFMPGHIEHIAGFASLRHALESVFGPMSTLALASQVYGLYTGFVYFTPVFGGLIADRLLGRKLAVAIGAVLMSAGHIAMAFDASFLLALVLLITGCGLLKGNISSQVGALYAEDDGNGRTRGFSIFSVGINVGAVAGPLVCGLLAQKYGWHVGFGLAGVLMLIGLATYLIGYHTLVEPPPSAVRKEAHATEGSTNWRIVITLIAVMALTDLSLDRLLPELEHRSRLDQRSRRPRSARLPRSGRVVQLDRSVQQHRLRADPDRTLEVAGLAGRRAKRDHQDLDRRVDGVRGQPAALRRLLHQRSRERDLPDHLRPHPRRRLPLLLADAARARLTRRAGGTQGDAHGLRLPHALHLEHSHRLDRRILRAHDAGDVLGDARGDRGRRRVARDAPQQAAEPPARALA